MPVSLIGPTDCPLVHRVLLIAAYAGIKLKLVPIVLGVDNESEAFRLNCHPLYRVPVLKTDEGYLAESNAIIRYLARTEVLLAATSTETEKIPHPQYPVPYAMYGHTLAESGEVDSWLEFAMTRVDVFVKMYDQHETTVRGHPGEEIKHQLWANLGGLEKRLVTLRTERKSGCQQSGGALTARNVGDCTSAEDSYLMDDDHYFLGNDTRLSSVYNVAGSIRDRMEGDAERVTKEKHLAMAQHNEEVLCGGNGGDDGTIANSNSTTNRRPQREGSNPRPSQTPRASILAAARTGSRSARPSLGGASTSIQRQDLLFIVGDSLTAADLVLASALQMLYNVKELRSDALQAFPLCHRYYRSVMMLPVAADIRRALSITLVN